MPTGSFVRRRLDDRLKTRDKYALMYDWVEYFNNTHGLHIQHKLNMAKENKIGPYPVDGFDAQKPPCINFTDMTGMEKIVDGKDSQRAEIVSRTTGQERQDHQNVDLDKDAGNILSSKNGNVDVKARFEETTSSKPSVIPRNHRHHNVLSQNTKFQKLFRTIAFFGMMECDIQVSDVWSSHFQLATMTTFEYYKDMPPLFCSILSANTCRIMSDDSNFLINLVF